ncbi:MAG: hypothetical protein WB770_08045 [Acidimicrobiales bacterium]
MVEKISLEIPEKAYIASDQLRSVLENLSNQIVAQRAGAASDPPIGIDWPSLNVEPIVDALSRLPPIADSERAASVARILDEAPSLCARRISDLESRHGELAQAWADELVDGHVARCRNGRCCWTQGQHRVAGPAHM